MKEYPILFNGEMVRAILNGDKTQTRRIPSCRNAKWQKEDRLWIKETWNIYAVDDGALSDQIAVIPKQIPVYNHCLLYKATEEDSDIKFRSPLHMPRWASRITLEIMSMSEEMLQDITEDDAKKEGVLCNCAVWPKPCQHCISECYAREEYINYFSDDSEQCYSARDSFKSLWDSINSERGYNWESNPIVKVIKFKVIT